MRIEIKQLSGLIWQADVYLPDHEHPSYNLTGSSLSDALKWVKRVVEVNGIPSQ